MFFHGQRIIGKFFQSPRLDPRRTFDRACSRGGLRSGVKTFKYVAEPRGTCEVRYGILSLDGEANGLPLLLVHVRGATIVPLSGIGRYAYNVPVGNKAESELNGRLEFTAVEMRKLPPPGTGTSGTPAPLVDYYRWFQNDEGEYYDRAFIGKEIQAVSPGDVAANEKKLISFLNVGRHQLNAVWYVHKDGPGLSGTPTGRVARGTLDIDVVDMSVDVTPNPAVVRPRDVVSPDEEVTIKVKSVNPASTEFRAMFLAEREAGSGGHEAGKHKKVDGSGDASVDAGDWATWPKLPVGTFAGGAIKTSSGGEVSVKYKPSQFGGKERVRVYVVGTSSKFEARGWDGNLIADGGDVLDAEAAVLTSDVQQRILGKLSRHEFFFGSYLGSVEIEVKVPSLNQLTDGADYVKVGGTPQHKNENTHFGISDLISDIQTLANKFRSKPRTRGARLRVNDMSLGKDGEGYGGVFDVCGTWNSNDDCPSASDPSVTVHGHTPNFGHANGRAADINTGGFGITLWKILKDEMGYTADTGAFASKTYIDEGHYHIMR